MGRVRVPKISMTFEIFYNQIYHLSCIQNSDDICFSIRLLTFHANYQVEDRAASRVPKISMTFDVSSNKIYHI